jgi:hypothetical protein
MAADRETYNRMGAQRYIELFNWADRNRSRIISRDDEKGASSLRLLSMRLILIETVT